MLALALIAGGTACGADEPAALDADPSAVPETDPGSADGTVPPGTDVRVGTTPQRSIVVFTKAAGFRHDSIGPAAEVLRSRLTSSGAAVQVTEDAGVFDAGRLGSVDVVVFLSTTGDVLDDGQQAALESWVTGGGGWVGIHAALDAEYEWPFYESLAGAWFQSHPPVQAATVRVEQRGHPATAHLPTSWERTDEWYDLRRNPRPGVRVLATVDESTYDGGVTGTDHPIAWCDTIGRGNTFTTAMGHTTESWSEPAFVDHVLGGIASVTQAGSCG